MKVGELIEILKTVDPGLQIVTFAQGHSYRSESGSAAHGPMKVGYYYCGYDGEFPDGLILGNMWRYRFNYPNDWWGELSGEKPEDER